MDFKWQKMTIDEFAAFERILDQRVIASAGRYWRRVRPFFFRPLLAFHEYCPQLATAPRSAILGGFQHAVSDLSSANSFLNLMMFESPQRYSIQALDYNRKRQIKLAAKHLTIRVITGVAEFKEAAYGPYLSFYNRTKYGYGATRRNPDCFAAWADALFGSSKGLVLGGYRNGELGAVSLSQLVDNTLLYSTFFCKQEWLRLHVADLMLHSVREAASRCDVVKQIYLGMYKGRGGVDAFYLLRGCRIIHKPAFLYLNPLADLLLRGWVGSEYARLYGRIEGQGEFRGSNDDHKSCSQKTKLLPARSGSGHCGSARMASVF